VRVGYGLSTSIGPATALRSGATDKRKGPSCQQQRLSRWRSSSSALNPDMRAAYDRAQGERAVRSAASRQARRPSGYKRPKPPAPADKPSPAPLELWGSAELCEAFGVSRESLRKWKGKPGFPKPLADLAMGPVWDAAKVRAWHKAR
jgi:hypothetical protein